MLFYKVEGIIANTSAEQNDSRRAHKENVRETLKSYTKHLDLELKIW